MSLSFVNKVTALLVVVSLAIGGQAQAGHHEEKAMPSNIVATAQSAGTFNTLLAAAGAAGLADTLAEGGPFTVFAPTDDAFEALPAGTVETLLKPENKAQLARILKFHVLSGKVASTALADGISIATLAGAAATISATEGGFNIENARIVATDIDASNGVIHVIDRVILPPESVSQTRTPATVIDMAIEAGVPMFNHGNPAATAAIYRVAAESLLLANDELMADHARDRLMRGLERAANQRDMRSQAWTLRYALDDVRESLNGASTAVMAAN